MEENPEKESWAIFPKLHHTREYQNFQTKKEVMKSLQ